MPVTPNSSSLRNPTLSRQATAYQRAAAATRWGPMLAQALLTAVAVIGLLVLLAAVVPSSLVPRSLFLAQWPESEDSLTSTDGGNNNNNNNNNNINTNNNNNNTNNDSDSSISGTSLEYYVHVEIGAPNLAQLLAPVNSTKSASFGTAQLFAFNVTESASNSSAAVGVMRGYTLQSAYVSGQSFLVEVEVLEYHNPSSGVNGTLSIQGIVLNSPSTLAIVGGTGNFLGARGSVYIQQQSSSVYHHTVRFL